jgi:hypothetical protein
MSRNAYALVAAAMAIGLVASGCSNSTDSASKSTSSTSPATATQLQSLIPTPPNSQRTDGPDCIPNSGIHLHFVINGSSTEVMNACKTALEGKGWALTIVSSGGWQGAGGATYAATRGDTYGVFSGGEPRVLRTSVPAHGRQSPRIPTVAAAPSNNGELVPREPRTELTSVVNLIATERTVGTRKRGRN